MNVAYHRLEDQDDVDDDMDRLPSHDPRARVDGAEKSTPQSTTASGHLNRDESSTTVEERCRGDHHSQATDGGISYRTYKRRFLGLAQLVLLNIIVSWDWLTFAAVSTTSAQYFGVSQSAVNWLSTGFLFAFVPVAPLVVWVLNRGGPKASILVASFLVLLGNWIRYAGTRARGGHFGVVMFGQILIGMALPFVLVSYLETSRSIACTLNTLLS